MSVLHDVTNLHLPDIFAYPTPVAPEEMTLPLFKSRRADSLALLAREEYGEIPCRKELPDISNREISDMIGIRNT